MTNARTASTRKSRTPVKAKTKEPVILKEIVLPQEELDAAEIQAISEGVEVSDRRVEFMGEKFTVADSVGLMPLMKFAHASQSGLDTDEDNVQAMSAMYAMLRDCIHPDDWDRFERHAIDTKAEAEDLLPVVNQTMELISARPTKQPSDSSRGRSRTGRKSKADSSSKMRELGMTPVSELRL